jgi:ankyrin repeat protein
MNLGAAVCMALVLALAPAAWGQERPTGRDAALLEAVRAGDLPAVRKLLKQQGVDVNVGDFPNGFTPLIWAANKGDVELVKVLLAAGANPNLDDGAGQSALYLAMTSSLFEEERGLEQTLAVLELLCGAGAKAEAGLTLVVGFEGLTPVHLAAMTDPRLLRTLVTHCKADVNVADRQGRTPLHAILDPPFPQLRYTDAEASEHVRPLLDAGAKLDTTNRYGLTPLMSALLNGQRDTAQLLIKRGAALDKTSPGGMTMLMAAATAGDLSLVQQLLAAGADPKAQVTSKTSVLHFALLEARPGPEQLHIVQELLARGADPLLANDAGTTPLMLAASTGRLDLWKLLLERGGDVKAQEKKGATVLMHAAAGGNPDILAQLLAQGLDVRAADSEGDTALHRAARALKPEALAKLLDAGAPLEAKNKRAETPLRLAVACDQPDAVPAVRELLDAGAEPGKALEDAARCEDLSLYVAMLDAVATYKLRQAPPAEVDVLLWGGGKTEQEAQAWLAGFQQLAPRLRELLQPAEGFPLVVASDSVPGLAPGLHVVLLGYCGAEDAASRLKLLKALYPGAYTRRVKVPLTTNACPVVLFETTRNTTASLTDKQGRTLTVSSFEPNRPGPYRAVRFEGVLLARTGALLGHRTFTESKYRGHCEAADYEEEVLKEKRGLRLIQSCDNVSAEGEPRRRARDIHLFTITPKGTLELKALQQWSAPED